GVGGGGARAGAAAARGAPASPACARPPPGACAGWWRQRDARSRPAASGCPLLRSIPFSASSGAVGRSIAARRRVFSAKMSQRGRAVDHGAPAPYHAGIAQGSAQPMTTPMLPRERCDYSAIVDRPPLKLPNNARLAFWTIVNYEVWD